MSGLVPKDAAGDLRQLLDTPEVAALIADLEATRWTGRPGYPIRTMVGLSLLRAIENKPWTAILDLLVSDFRLQSILGIPPLPSIDACYRFARKFQPSRRCGYRGCWDPALQRGLCIRHYNRIKRAGRAFPKHPMHPAKPEFVLPPLASEANCNCVVLGDLEIASLLKVNISSVRGWIYHGKMPYPDHIVNGKPAWNQITILRWAVAARKPSWVFAKHIPQGRTVFLDAPIGFDAHGRSRHEITADGDEWSDPTADAALERYWDVRSMQE